MGLGEQMASLTALLMREQSLGCLGLCTLLVRADTP